MKCELLAFQGYELQALQYGQVLETYVHNKDANGRHNGPVYSAPAINYALKE